MTTNGTPLLLSPVDAARELGVGRDQMYKLIKEGRIRAIKFGTVIKVPRTELTAFVEKELGRSEPVVFDDINDYEVPSA